MSKGGLDAANGGHSDLLGSETGWNDGKLARIAPATVVLSICSKCRGPERVLTPAAIYDFQHHGGIGSRGSNAKRGALIGAVLGTDRPMASLAAV